MAAERAHDIVVWGASGFTGRLVAEYLANNAPAGLSWALGGRDRAKLEGVRSGLPENARSNPIVVFDAGSDRAMRELARSARVVCTTVGPYGRYGLPLARACAAEGSDYCDLTGEVPFMRQVIDTCHEAARASKSRIVHTCGFDSIPSDLGVFLLAREAEGPLGEVRLVMTESRGRTSGGTMASALDMIDAFKDPRIRRLMGRPHALDPDPSEGSTVRRRHRAIAWDPDLGSFVAPFPMEVVNARVVHRSNALLHHAYGRDFEYRERMIVGGKLRGLPGALAATAGMAGFVAGASFGPTRRLLEKRLPKPGEGPNERQRKRGFFKMTILACRPGERRPSLAAYVEGRSDPGYGETSKMLGESAMCLALDPRADGFEGGVLTPATAMGMLLVDRLRRAGMRFDVGPFSGG